MAGDFVALTAAYFFSVYLSETRINPGRGLYHFETPELIILLLLFIVWHFSAQHVNLYDEFKSRALNFEITSVLKASLIQASSAMLLVFVHKDPLLNRYFVFAYFLSMLLLLTTWKIILRGHLNRLRRNGKNIRTILILGLNRISLAFAENLQAFPHLGFRLIGFLDDNPKCESAKNRLGPLSRLDNILRTKTVDEVVIALLNYGHRRIDDIISVCEKYTTQVRIISDSSLSLCPKSKLSLLGHIPIVSVGPNPLEEMGGRILKRVFDFVFSLTLFLAIFILLWPIIALAIKLDSRGPVFYKQRRWGQRNKKFLCYKFRTMAFRCRQFDQNGNFLQAAKGDPRVTRVGRFLRRTNLDELPQFWNVLRGNMSIVGPRPHPIPLGQKAGSQIHHYLLRRLVKPGITGWAQINGYRGRTKRIGLMRKRIEYDLWYIRNWSIWLDFQIILLTLPMVLKPNSSAY